MDENKVKIAIYNVKQALIELGLNGSDKLNAKHPELDLELTPERIVRMWIEFTQGVRTPPPEIKVFGSSHSQMLVLKDIDFVSFCSHHFLPFQGKAHIAYLPDKMILGISKPARIIDHFASYPQTQELLTDQVAFYLQERLKPRGLMVVLEAEHTCISTRGAKKTDARFITSAVKGLFLTDPGVKKEFLDLLRIRRE